MCARQVFPLLVGIAVNCVIQEVAADTAVIEQSIAFSWRAIASNTLSRLLSLNEEAEQIAPGLANLFSKSGIGLQPLETGLALAPDEIGDGRPVRMSTILGMTDIDPQRAA